MQVGQGSLPSGDSGIKFPPSGDAAIIICEFLGCHAWEREGCVTYGPILHFPGPEVTHAISTHSSFTRSCQMAPSSQKAGKYRGAHCKFDD